MANKYFRKNLNKGGGADSGRMGEIKSKLAVAGMKAKKDMGRSTGGLTKEQIEKLKKIMEQRKKDRIKEMIPLNKGGRAALKRGSNPGGKSKKSFEEKTGIRKSSEKRPSSKKFYKEFSDGGRAALKKGSKFPDHSGDGKITQKDILMAKGVIPKKKNKKKVI